jgi:hypothetical protein
MKKIIFGVLVLSVLLLSAACTSITRPVAITDNPVGSKTGETTASYLFGRLQLSGDMGLSTAAANGWISKIATVENRVETNPFMVKITTIVTGDETIVTGVRIAVRPYFLNFNQQ